jgi:hypothetical protein
VSAAWIILVSALRAIIWPLIQLGAHVDKEDDPKTQERRKQLSTWLSEQSKRSLKARLHETHQTFFYLFDRLFSAKGSIVEQSIWAGLLLSPIILGGIRIPSLVGAEASIPWVKVSFEDTAASLLVAILLAFSVSLGVVIGRSHIGRELMFLLDSEAESEVDSEGFEPQVQKEAPLKEKMFLLYFSVLEKFIELTSLIPIIIISLMITIGIGILLEIVFFKQQGQMTGSILLGLFLGISLGLSSHRFPGMGGLITVGTATTLLVIGILNSSILTSVLGSDMAPNLIILTTSLIAGRLTSHFVQDVHISVHPLKALGSSLAYIIVVGLVASLIRADAATSFFVEMINGEGIKILAFVAFNMFADTISLLETRWVLQRGSNTTVVQLLGLLALDLAASGAIFLFLPAVVGELNTFWDAVFLRGDRPWLGVLFWSTFGTSVLFYLFVIAVFLFLLPGHALATGFRRVIGSFSSIEVTFPRKLYHG